MVLSLDEAYKVLGVTAKTAAEDVKKAYKRLALKTHPDKNPNDPDASKKFLRVSEAYKRISDPSSCEDEEDGLPNEDEMEAMFNMMFAEMMGMNSMNGMHEISPEMFAAMEDMMMNGGEDDEVLAAMMFGGHGSFDSSDEDDGEHYGDDELLEMLMHELMRPGKNKRGKSMKSSKSGRFPSVAKSTKGAKQSKDSSDESSDWSTESESETEQAVKNGSRFDMGSSSKSPSSTSKSGKLKSGSMDRPGSFRMGEGSRRVPPRVSSFRATNKARTPSTDASHDADAKPTGQANGKVGFRQRTDSNDEKIEISLRSAEAKASNMSMRARVKAENDVKAAARLQCDLVMGDRVLVQDKLMGTVAYVGAVHYAKGHYVGVVMDHAQDGKNNGTVKGTEYFKTGANKGLMVPLSDVFKC